MSAEIKITIDDIPEELVYEWLYGEPLWPDVIGDKGNDETCYTPNRTDSIGPHAR